MGWTQRSSGRHSQQTTTSEACPPPASTGGARPPTTDEVRETLELAARESLAPDQDGEGCETGRLLPRGRATDETASRGGQES